MANVPLAPGIESPEDLFLVDPGRVFGLDINTSRLISHRIKRLSDYALSVFRRGGFTVIKVTNKPIESVANEIIEHS